MEGSLPGVGLGEPESTGVPEDSYTIPSNAARKFGQLESSSAGLAEVLDFVRRARGFRADGYCLSVLEARVRGRLLVVGADGFSEYRAILEASPPEVDALVEALTVKVTGFFRDPFVFEYLAEFVLPPLVAARSVAKEKGLRVWSAGCASGEEPFSVAILLRDLARRENVPPEVTVFATDVDEAALARGRQGLFPARSVANVRHRLLASYFRPEGDSFRVVPEIAALVRFSVHDMLDLRTAAPAESVFGTFDLVLCRNVLIYFDALSQGVIFEKLNRSTAPGAYLLLGRTETPPEIWRRRMRRVADCPGLLRKPEGEMGGAAR